VLGLAHTAIASRPPRRSSSSATPTRLAARLGWLATAVLLELNGVRASRARNDDVYDLVIWIASENPALDEITVGLRRVTTPRRRRR
jgi:hypothetical protein